MRSSLKIIFFAVIIALSLASCSNSPKTSASHGAREAGPGPRAAEIRHALAAFERTGEYGYLCHAALMGSREAADRLSRDGMRCSR